LFKKIGDLENIINLQNKEIVKLKGVIKEQKAINEKLKNLENIVNDQKNKIGKISNIEKAIKEQNREIEKIKEWKNEYDLEIEEMQVSKVNSVALSKIDSKIIKKIEELEFLEKRLKYNEILKKKNITYKLLYRATRDGNDMRTFHNKCDNIMGTLSIVKTTKGMRFGGYTEKKWNCSSNSPSLRKDDKDICFCFSLDLFKIYNFNVNFQSSIYSVYDMGPYFYCTNECTFFYINRNNGLLFGYTNYNTKNKSFGKFDSDFEINNGNKEFSVVELEVFQILFDN